MMRYSTIMHEHTDAERFANASDKFIIMGMRPSNFFVDEYTDGSGTLVEFHYHESFIEDLIRFFLYDSNTMLLLMFLYKCLMKRDGTFESYIDDKPSKILKDGEFTDETVKALLKAYRRVSPCRCARY